MLKSVFESTRTRLIFTEIEYPVKPAAFVAHCTSLKRNSACWSERKREKEKEGFVDARPVQLSGRPADLKLQDGEKSFVRAQCARWRIVSQVTREPALPG